MDLDLSQLSIAELNDLEKRIKRAVKSRLEQEKKAAKKERENKRRDVVKQVHHLLGTHRLDIEEIISYRHRKRTNNETETPATEAAPPKYRNPENTTETWAGRGRRPNWILALLGQGKKLEDFII